MEHLYIFNVQGAKGNFFTLSIGTRFLFILILFQVALNFLFICLLFRIVNGKFTHEIVAWVPIPALSLHVEVEATLTGKTLVHQVAISKQN